MVDKKKVIMIFCVGILMFLTVSNAKAAFSEPFNNGEFVSPLSTGWTRYEAVSIVNGVGVLGESVDFGWTYLEQEFTLPLGVTGLSFEYQPLFDVSGIETFTASLLDSSKSPLVSYDTVSSYFFMHDWNDYLDIDAVTYNESFVAVNDLGNDWYRVTLDLMSLQGLPLDAILAFDLIAPGFDGVNWDGGFDSQIRIDNVFVQTGPSSVIPAPGAIILVLVGLGNLRLAMRRYVTQ